MPRILVRTGIVVALLIAPTLVFAAAYNDVSLTTDTVFSVGGIALDVYSATASVETAVVNDSSVTLTLLPGSFVTVIAPGGNIIGQSGGDSYITVTECDNNASQVGFSYPTGSGAVTIVLTPSATTCSGGNGGNSSSSSSSGSSSSGGGGGGGSISTPAPVVTPAPAATPTTTTTTTTTTTNASGLSNSQITAILNVLASFNADQSVIDKVSASLHGSTSLTTSVSSFTRDLELGATGADVMALQVFLNAHGFAVAASGAGSQGHETTMFGGLTKAALIKFQKANGITPVAGYFGAKTRAYIAAHY